MAKAKRGKAVPAKAEATESKAPVPVEEPDIPPVKAEKEKKKEAPGSGSAKERGVKRKLPSETLATKRLKIDSARFLLRGPHLEAVLVGGSVLTVGQGDTGQLGHGADTMEVRKPKTVSDLSQVIAVCAGGMHTLCLRKDGQVFSFGCNDDGALGRVTEDDDETYTPGQVKIDGKVVQISAGDSHSVALTDEGKVYYWGTFRDNSGPFGLTPDGKQQPAPILLALTVKVKKIASGENHIAMLTEDGQIYTLGCAEQGRLGRIGEPFSDRGGRRGLKLPLTADKVHARNLRISFIDVWAGSMSTVALSSENDVLVCGLNNYSQLGIPNKTIISTMTKSPAFTAIAKDHGLAQVTFGQHHILLLDGKGKVTAIGRHDYGVLGIGEVSDEVKSPTPVSGNLTCVEIACGSSVSYSITKTGEAFSWGMGTNGQLAIDVEDEDEDAYEPTKMVGKQLNGKKVLSVSGGGQHAVLLVASS